MQEISTCLHSMPVYIFSIFVRIHSVLSKAEIQNWRKKQITLCKMQKNLYEALCEITAEDWGVYVPQ